MFNVSKVNQNLHGYLFNYKKLLVYLRGLKVLIYYHYHKNAVSHPQIDFIPLILIYSIYTSIKIKHNVTYTYVIVSGCVYMTDKALSDQNYYCHIILVTGNEKKEGDIRLVGGNYLWQGRVEIFISGVWGTVYDYYDYYFLSSNEARVVCRQLGYNTYSKLHSN